MDYCHKIGPGRRGRVESSRVHKIELFESKMESRGRDNGGSSSGNKDSATGSQYPASSKALEYLRHVYDTGRSRQIYQSSRQWLIFAVVVTLLLLSYGSGAWWTYGCPLSGFFTFVCLVHFVYQYISLYPSRGKGVKTGHNVYDSKDPSTSRTELTRETAGSLSKRSSFTSPPYKPSNNNSTSSTGVSPYSTSLKKTPVLGQSPTYYSSGHRRGVRGPTSTTTALSPELYKENFSVTNADNYAQRLYTARGTSNGLYRSTPETYRSPPSLQSLHDYHTSPLVRQPIFVLEPQKIDALDFLELSYIPDEWIDNLRLQLGNDLHNLLHRHEEMLRVCHSSLKKAVEKGEMKDSDLSLCLGLLDLHDPDHLKERLDNGYEITTEFLVKFLQDRGVLPVYFQHFEALKSFLRLCHGLMTQSMEQQQQQHQRRGNGQGSEMSRAYDLVHTARKKSSVTIIDRLKQLMHNSHDKHIRLES